MAGRPTLSGSHSVCCLSVDPRMCMVGWRRRRICSVALVCTSAACPDTAEQLTGELIHHLLVLQPGYEGSQLLGPIAVVHVHQSASGYVQGQACVTLDCRSPGSLTPCGPLIGMPPLPQPIQLVIRLPYNRPTSEQPLPAEPLHVCFQPCHGIADSISHELCLRSPGMATRKRCYGTSLPVLV